MPWNLVGQNRRVDVACDLRQDLFKPPLDGVGQCVAPVFDAPHQMCLERKDGARVLRVTIHIDDYTPVGLYCQGLN